MKKLAIFASGSGTNAENIILYFKNHAEISVDIILSNRSDAFVIERAPPRWKRLNTFNLVHISHPYPSEEFGGETKALPGVGGASGIRGAGAGRTGFTVLRLS